MTSHTTKRFRTLLARLPQETRKQAREAYLQFERDPFHPGLRFKRVHSRRPIYAVRISRDCRALGIQRENEIIWFWIGTHADYETLLKEMRKT